jgi:PhzF family phenazine biosynthesis protein
VPYQGNPVAVVLDADALAPEQMQRIARWTNLSETTFVLKPKTAGADYLVRIFTPRAEIPFAGHPTLGTAHALLEGGALAKKHKLVQECAGGLIAVDVVDTPTGRRLFLELPRARARTLDDGGLAELDAALGARARRDVRARVIDVGAVWITCVFNDPQTVRKLAPDMAKLAALSERHGAYGVTVFAPDPDEGEAVQAVVRSFAPAVGVAEDPVCGSGNGCVAVFLMQASDLYERIGARYIASQGREVGRDGYVHVEIHDDGRIQLGGAAVTCVDGKIST